MNNLITVTYFFRPKEDKIIKFRSDQAKNKPNYKTRKQTKKIEHQKIKVKIGEGPIQFEHAKNLIREWRVFETPDGTPYPPNEPPKVGQTTINLLREFGLWFLLACRITKVLDEQNQYGFTFETLPGHVECGWETFLVSLDEETDIVYYTIQSESVHSTFIMTLGSPIVHYLQKRYKKNSAKKIKELMNDKYTSNEEKPKISGKASN